MLQSNATKMRFLYMVQNGDGVWEREMQKTILRRLCFLHCEIKNAVNVEDNHEIKLPVQCWLVNRKRGGRTGDVFLLIINTCEHGHEDGKQKLKFYWRKNNVSPMSINDTRCLCMIGIVSQPIIRQINSWKFLNEWILW